MSATRPPHVWVDSDLRLKRAAKHWAKAPMVGMDIEFVRFNTYYPQAALYQIACGSSFYLIDALAIDDFAPLVELLVSNDTVKVVHGGGEDMEVIRTHLDTMPRSLFDTQLAACIVGQGWCIGYAALVRNCLGIELSKEERMSDWLARPLTPSQIRYCLQDVAYLIEVHGILSREIERLNRAEWFREEMRQWLVREEVRPDNYYLKVAGVRQMTPRQQAVLKSLCEWREHEARRKDQPRQWVVRDEHILKFARLESLDEAKVFKALPKQVARRFGKGLIEAFYAGRASESPTDVAEPPSRGSREAVRSILDAVARIAGELGIPQELLGRRREIERCVRLIQEGDLQPGYLSGWRDQYLRPVFDRELGVQEGS